MSGECSRLQTIVNNSIASCWSTARPQINRAITDIYNLVCVAASDTCIKEVPDTTPISNFITLGWGGILPTPAECPLLYIIRGTDAFIAVNNGALTEDSWCQLCTADACSVVLPAFTPPAQFVALGWGGAGSLPLQSECPVLFVMEGCNVWLAPNDAVGCDLTVGGTAWVKVTAGGSSALVFDDIPSAQTDRGVVVNWLDGKGLTDGGEIHQVNLADDLSSIVASWATVAGGSDQTISGDHGFIGAGLTNEVSGLKGFVGAGTLNVVAGENAAAVAGSTNTPQAENSFIGGGFSNDIDTDAISAAIVAGNNNSIAAFAENAAIVAGNGNQITGAFHNFIGAGNGNIVSGTSAAVVAGTTNTVTAGDSFVGAGSANVVERNRSAIVAGILNSVNGTAGADSFIGAGQSNEITDSERAFIGAGNGNSIEGDNSAIVAGSSNSVTADGAFAIGNSITNSTANGIAIAGAADLLGFFNITPVVQQAGIADPTGGATIDAEARTAIIALITAMEQYGLLITV